MAWQELVMRLDRPSCPEASRAGRARISCIRPGHEEAPVAYTNEPVDGWEAVGDDGLSRRTEACTGCPARRLPSALVVRCVDIEDGAATIHAMAPDRSDIRHAFDALEAAGQQPSIRRVRASDDARRPQWIDLGILSPRQWDALRAAHEIGYFGSGGGVDALAAAMDCGRSAAHEHLRKALARLVASAVDRTGPDAPSQAR